MNVSNLRLFGKIVCCLTFFVVGHSSTAQELTDSVEQSQTDLQTPEISSERSVLTLDALVDGVRRQYGSIKALEVNYEQVTVGSDAKNEFLPFVKHHYGFRSDQRFKSDIALANDSAEPEPQIVFAYNGSAEQVFQPTFKTATIMPNKQVFLDKDAYCHALGIPLSDQDRASVNDSHHFIPYVLDSPQFSWKVQVHLEIVDGIQCHVLEETQSRQRLWIDTTHAFSIVFREIYHFVANEPAENWPLAERYSFGSFQQLTEAIWLPQSIKIVSFNTPHQPRNFWNTKAFSTVHRITDVKVNDEVKDALFTLEFPLGTTVRDSVENRFYQVGDVGEQLDLIVAESEELLPSTSGIARFWLVGLNAILVLLLLVFYIYRRFFTKGE